MRIYYGNQQESEWQKSHRSNSQGNCVQVALVDQGQIEQWRQAGQKPTVAFIQPETVQLVTQPCDYLGKLALAV